MLKGGRIGIPLIVIIVATLVISSWLGANTKTRAERAHGIKLPPSATNLQQKSWGFLMDKTIASLFEIDRSDIRMFTNQLKIMSRHGPAKSGPGNPCINGYNVWPQNSYTFVPGNVGEFKRTWKGDAVPLEMLSCGSPKGDWLHVEIWSLTNGALIKICTDWN